MITEIQQHNTTPCTICYKEPETHQAISKRHKRFKRLMLIKLLKWRWFKAAPGKMFAGSYMSFIRQWTLFVWIQGEMNCYILFTTYRQIGGGRVQNVVMCSSLCLTLAKRRLYCPTTVGSGQSSFLMISKLWLSWVKMSTTELENRACSDVCWNCRWRDKKANCRILEHKVVSKYFHSYPLPLLLFSPLIKYSLYLLILISFSSYWSCSYVITPQISGLSAHYNHYYSVEILGLVWE